MGIEVISAFPSGYQVSKIEIASLGYSVTVFFIDISGLHALGVNNLLQLVQGINDIFGLSEGGNLKGQLSGGTKNGDP